MPVGDKIPRADGRDKVTGVSQYIDDLPFSGLYGRTLRSRLPHGKVKAIEFDPNFDWSKIVSVDYRDLPGPNVIALIEDDQPCLVESEFKHAEEAILLLACEDKDLLDEACRHVKIIEEPLPILLDPEQSIKAGWILKTLEIERGDLAAGFAKAAHIVEGTYRVGHQEQLYIETQGIIATPRHDGGITIEGSMQCPYYVHRALTVLFGLPDEKVQIIQTVTGGGFGGKEDYPSIISAHAALLARKANRAVKMIYERGEDIRATTKRHPAIIRHRWGVSKDGDILAAEMNFIIDGGAYITLSPVVLSRGLIHGLGPYRHEAAKMSGQIAGTHTPPNGAFRGFGAPQSLYAAERHIDKIAKLLGKDPIALRKYLSLREGDLTVTGQELKESVGAFPVLDASLPKYYSRKQRVDAFNEEAKKTNSPLRRGIGFSYFFHGNGFTGNGEAKIKGKVDAEVFPDGRVKLYTGSTDIGQGTLTIFRQISAESLGLEVSQIDMAPQDTNQVPNSGPTVASRTCMVVGKVVEDVSRALIEELSAFIDKDSMQRVYYNKGLFTLDTFDQRGEVSNSYEVGTLADVAKAYAAKNGKNLRLQRQYQTAPGLVWDDKTYRGDAYPVYSWATDVVEVEVDTDTAEIRVVSCYTAHDIGRPIHPILAEGQVEGGTLQGLGYAFMEEVVWKDGRVYNDRLTNYIIPTSLDAPEIEVELVHVPYSGGPFGAKGVGEIPMDGPAPAVAQAIDYAVNVEATEAPLTPEKLMRLMSARS
jgi:CO/xanthine dehydrogenase Mo-binding subunit